MPTPDGAPAPLAPEPLLETVIEAAEHERHEEHEHHAHRQSADDGGLRLQMLGDLRLGWMDLVCVVPILAASAWALFGSPIAPGLIDTHPVLLAALRGSIPSMIVCGSFAHAGRLPLWQAIVAPLPILIWVDPFYYWAGRRYGRALLDHYRRQGPKLERRIDQAERLFARYGVGAIAVSAFLPIQTFLFLAAGETRMPLWKFLAADLVGNLLWISLVVSLGWVFKDQGVQVAETIGHYGTFLTIALVVVVVVVSVRSSMQQARTSR